MALDFGDLIRRAKGEPEESADESFDRWLAADLKRAQVDQYEKEENR